ncbi:MAG TPA: hypothetical protein VLN08_03490 [Vicinamibacterales bacterium]|nr:hypothetical protein [Vicinamibacterales bacterium]
MLRHLRAVVWLLVAALALVTAAACATSRPRQRPIEGGAVDAGAGSLASVRQQLEGTWNLVSADLVSPSGGRTTARATAVLTYDAFGNFAMKGEFDDPAATAEQKSALNFTGRAVIDIQKRVLRLLDVQQPEGDFAALPPDLAALRERAYAFEGDLLTLTVKDASGRVTAINTWRRQAR